MIVMVHHRCFCYETGPNETTTEATHNLSAVFKHIKIKVQLKENVYQHLEGRWKLAKGGATIDWIITGQ